ncbi:MAG: AAA family ATPase [Bacteroidales bacterium]
MKNIAINIGRQLATGGLDIGKYLAKQLNYNFYDKAIIRLIAVKSGMSPEFLDDHDERNQIHSGFLSALSMNTYFYDNIFLLDKSISNFFTDTIVKLSKESNSVFVGRCADYILKDRARCFNVFLYAPLDFRIEILKGRLKGKSENEIKKIIKNTDKSRAAYYNRYTDKTWGDPNSYNLMIDTSVFGIKKTAEILYDYVKNFTL